MAELKTFVFTDISGSVRLKNEMAGRSVTERDRAFIQTILTPHRERIEAKLPEFGGRVVSTAGDGHFLVFDNTAQAALWAVAVQESHRDEPIAAPSGDPVEVRISMHVGVPQVDPSDPNNFVGKTVDYAARLNDYANGAQILVSRSVMAILDDVGLQDLRLHLHGKKNLKGIGSVEVHELLYDDHGPRPMRSQPKINTERQWTVVPTIGFEGGAGEGAGGVAVAPGTALRHVGNYELEELLGSGGMGDVYKARHTQFGRIRAVKIIKPQFVASGQTEIIRRFYNEIKAVGRLEHKNIVVAIDSSAPSDKVHYLVMEFIDGVGADDLVSQHGPLPIAEACEIIRQAARGLQFIHKNDMVHRDIKPSNLMVTLVEGDGAGSDSSMTQAAEGERAVVKILDLGLALLAGDAQDRLTRFDHKAMGTGMYMPPEQWKTTSVDIRADIYSLGCTLYHLLSGNPPFYDSDLRPEKAHEKSAVPPIRSHLQPMPKRLWDVLRKMLEKRPEDRYSTPAEVSAALAPFAEGHHLAALVRSVETGVPVSDAMRETKSNAASPVDTWRSKPLLGSGEFLRTRSRTLWTGLRIVAVAAVITGAVWLTHQRKLQFIADQLDSAKQSLPSFARAAAKGKLSEEIAKRFETLSKLASDPILVAALAAHDAAPENPKALKDLDDWIGTLTHSTGISVDSWFVDDENGFQVARSPREDTISKSFSWRDYFHGRGHDLTEAETAAAKPEPIQRPNLSVVYKSSSSDKLKVAFSVPIWDRPPQRGDGEKADKEPASPQQPSQSANAEQAAKGDKAADGSPPPEHVAKSGESSAATPEETGAAEKPVPSKPPTVIGVLAMSVNVADFEVLKRDLQGGNEVVLIDLQPVRIDKEEMPGVILQHPRQEQGEFQQVDKKVLDEINVAKPTEDPKFRSEDHFLTGYHDPFDKGHTYWGAFQPVEVNIPASRSESEKQSRRIPWVVLVQKPMAE